MFDHHKHWAKFLQKHKSKQHLDKNIKLDMYIAQICKSTYYNKNNAATMGSTGYYMELFTTA